MPHAAPTFYFDYVDPLSWCVEAEVARLERQGTASFERCPLELRPPPARLLGPTDDPWSARWAEAEASGSPAAARLRRPGLVPWSRKAVELALYAREHDAFERVHPALFRAFHEEGRDVGRVDVLVDLASAQGLDAGETRAVLDVDRYTEGVRQLRADAERAGVRGVPTLLVGAARYEGVLGNEDLERLSSRR